MKNVGNKILTFILVFMLGLVPFIAGVFLLSSNNETQFATTLVGTTEESEEDSYIYKSFTDYFTDYNFSKITLSGEGTAFSPYQINSTTDFLHFLTDRSFNHVSASSLPSGYTKVEYIQSTGTQYIDTGIKGSSNVKMQFEGAFERISGFSYVTGSRTAFSKDLLCFFANVGNLDCQYGTVQYKISNTSTNKMLVKISKDGVFLNDELQYSVDQSDWSNNYNITIFAVNTGGQLSYGKGHKIYYYKLYENNVLVRDFVPCLDDKTGEAGLYDLVTQTFYRNIGEGEFSYAEEEAVTMRSLSNKYVELNADIILNDETFDENGSPLGGDGVIYEWNKSFKWTSIHLDGKGHSVKGLYANGTSGSFSLFWNSTFSRIENIKVENFYVTNGSNISVLCYNGGAIANCIVGKGSLIGVSNVASLCQSASSISYCKNYANVTATGGAAYGIAKGNASSINYTDNYGNVTATGQAAGFQYGACSANKCKNYGNVSGNSYVGGFIIFGEGANFSECENHGDVTFITYKSNYVAAGFIVYSYNGVTKINKCTNKGYIQECAYGGSAQFMGKVYKLTGYEMRATLYLTYCKSYLDTTRSGGTYTLVGYTYGDKAKTRITNCEIIIENFNKFSNSAFIVKTYTSDASLEVSDVNIILKSSSAKHSITLGSATYMKDINIRTNFEVSNASSIVSKKVVKGGIVVDTSGTDFYFGNDLENFYSSWKTGKIGLKSIDGVGSFQSQVTEEMLRNKGFADMTPDPLDFNEDFMKVEYIESTGTQYINLGLTYNSTTDKVVSETAFVRYGDNGGCASTPMILENNNYFGIALRNSDLIPKGRFILGTAYQDFNFNLQLNQKYKCLIDGKVAYVDGTQMATLSNDIAFTQKMYIFARNTNGTASLFQHMKLYSLQVYTSNRLVRDYVPCYRKSDGVAGLYDLVEGKFYTNSGTGTFIAGPQV